MKVLLIHNRYLQPGGEDIVFEVEKILLERYGDRVYTFIENNIHFTEMNFLKAAINVVWSRKTQRKLQQLIKELKPNVVHFHNTFLMISPAAYYACKEAGVPVVQTLHNYRLICPGALLFRKGRICEQCIGKSIP